MMAKKHSVLFASSLTASGILAAFFAAVFFLLLTATGFRLLLNSAASIAPFLGMTFEATSSEGSFSRELKIAELFWEYPAQTGTKRVKIKNLNLKWEPFKLWQFPPQLMIEKLSVDCVFVDFIDPENPPTTPSALKEKPVLLKNIFPEESHLPVRFEVKELKIGEFFWQQKRLFHNAELALKSASTSHENHFIENLSVFYEDLKFSVTGAIASKKPFAFQAQASAAGNLQNLLKTQTQKNVSLTADLSGSLEGIVIKLKTDGALISEGALELNPLSVQPLEKGFLSISPVVLKEWGLAVPATLNAQLHLIQKNQELHGTVFIGNADKNLPIKSVSGNFAFDKNFGAAFAPLHVFFFDDASKITANGHFKEQIRADLQISTVNLKKFSKTLPQTNLNGKIVLKGTMQKAQMEVALADSDARPPLMLQSQAFYENEAIAFKSFLLEYGAGKMTMAGKVHLKGAQNFQARLNFQNFDFKEIVADSRLNGHLQASGKLSPLEIATDFALNDSQLFALALEAKGVANLTPTALKNANIAASWGKNTLAIRGELGQKGKGLLKVESQLADLTPLKYRGAATLNAEIAGNWDAPTMRVTATADEINNKNGFLLQDLKAQFNIGTRLDSPFESHITLKQLDAENTPQLLREFQWKTSGTNQRHQITLKTRLPKREYLDFDITGGFQTALFQIKNAKDIWSGTINLLNYYHRTRGGYQIQKGNTIALGTTNWKIENLNIQTQNGSKFAFKVPFQAHLNAHGNAQKTQLHATLENKELHNKIDFSAELTNSKNPWTIDESAPWHVKLNANIAQMAWLSESLGENWELGGVLDAHLALEGSPQKPIASGVVKASALKLAQNDLLLNLFDGALDLTIDRNTLQLKEFFWKSALQTPPPMLAAQPGTENLKELTQTHGNVHASGHLHLMTDEENSAHLDVTLERFAPVQQADQWLILSGNAQMRWAKETLEALGDLKIDAGFWQIKGLGSPSLSSDVIVRKTQSSQTEPPKIAWQPKVSLNIDMGRHFMFTGYGLSTLLDGKLKIIAQGQDLPRAIGTINTRGGRFEAYGQRLMIRRGRLSFENLINNPSLDVEAFRFGGKIAAGVKIGGTVERPGISLISEPNVPDAEKLSWLILGHGPEDMSMGDAALLVSAADGLLGNSSGGLIAQMRSSIGIDEFNISQGDMGGNFNKRRITSRVVGSMQDSTGATNDQILTIGKRITHRMRLVYEQSLGQADSLLRLFTRMKYGVMFIVGTGSDTTFDFFYRYVRGLPPQDKDDKNA